MKKPKLTGWIPMSTPPVREGVYEVRSNGMISFPYPYGYWDGLSFNGCDDTPIGAYRNRHEHSISLSNATNYWRGLAEDPNKA